MKNIKGYNIPILLCSSIFVTPVDKNITSILIGCAEFIKAVELNMAVAQICKLFHYLIG